MRRGEFAAAWTISDAALRSRSGQPCAHWPRHQQYIWDGRPLHGRRVLVRCYHGLGDTVQFVRYVPSVKAIAREVIVWAQPALLPLLGTMPEIDRLLPLHDGAPDCVWDVDVEIMELAHVARSTLETLPATVPYLHAEPAALGVAATLNVGLAWSAGDWDDRRSVPFAALQPLLATQGVVFHNLQRGPARDECAPELASPAGGERVEDTAAAMQALDLVISVDSFPAHLAGALGVPIWTLLHADPDWRWLRGREDSPWYPTMRLFRQARAGEWDPVITRVSLALAELVIARRRRSNRVRSTAAG